MIPWETIVIGAVGAMIGGTIVTLFGPVLQPAASYLNKNIWIALGRFDPPAPRAYTLTNTRYKEGSLIDSFPDETWLESYELVDFHLQNTSRRPLTDLQAFLSFDGIVVESTIMDSSYRGVEVTPTTDGEVYNQTGSETVHIPAAHGAMDVFLDRLPPGRSVRAKFLIDTDPNDMRSIVLPGDETSTVFYRWDFHNVTYTDSQLIEDESGEI